MDAHTIYHLKNDVIWALGPKAKHEIMGPRAERRQHTTTTETIQEDIHARPKRIPQQSTILPCKAGRRQNTR